MAPQAPYCRTIRGTRCIHGIALLFVCALYTAAIGYGQTDDVSGWIEGLRSPDSSFRLQCAKKLEKITDFKEIQALIALLKDPDAFVRMRATGVVAQIGASAVEPLISSLEDPDKNVRRHAAVALGERKDPRATAPLIAALRDADPDIQYDAAKALGKIKKASAIEPLMTLLNSELYSVRGSAAEALSNIGEPAVQPLIAVLSQGNWHAQRRAAEALGSIQDQRARDRLLSGLREQDYAVIVGACKLFVERGEPESEHLLIQALNAKGDKDMAEVLLNCGNPTLETAANRWAAGHGYRIMRSPGGGNARWGARR